MDTKKFLPINIGNKGILFENRYQKLYRVNVEFDGFSKEYFVTEFGDRVSAIIVKDRSILLVRQYRYLINGFSYELPGGGVHDSETPEQAVIRECLEETGIRIKNPSPLVDYHLTLDGVNNYTRIFFSKEIEIVEDRPPNSHEVVDKMWIRLEDCLQWIATRKILDSMTILGLLYYSTREGR